MRKTIHSLIAAFFLASILSIPTKASAYYCDNCSTEMTAWLSEITNIDQFLALKVQIAEAAEQTVQQITMVGQNIEQYENMIRNTIALPQDIVNRLQGQYQNLVRLYKQVGSYSRDLDGISQAYKAVYPAFGQNLREFQSNYSNWSASVVFTK